MSGENRYQTEIEAYFAQHRLHERLEALEAERIPVPVTEPAIARTVADILANKPTAKFQTEQEARAAVLAEREARGESPATKEQEAAAQKIYDATRAQAKEQGFVDRTTKEEGQ
jgi:hypothetical protein